MMGMMLLTIMMNMVWMMFKCPGVVNSQQKLLVTFLTIRTRITF